MNRILLIDDDEATRVSTSRLLTHLGYEVKEACNGMEGITLFQNSDRWGIVITDLRMPIINGNDVARKIRESNHPGTPIVAITGSEFVEEIERDLFDSVLIKPFRLETLVDMIRSLTG